MQRDLDKMRVLFLNKSFKRYAGFVYPKVVQMFGNEDKMIVATQSSIEKMEKDGFKFVNIYFKNFNKSVIKGNEMQTTFTQVILMDTPKGRITGEYTMIGISDKKGENWKFIDTSNYDKNFIFKKFPNLSEDLIINPKRMYPLDEADLKAKCSQFKNMELQTISFSGNKTSTIITENEQKEIFENSVAYVSNIVRDPSTPCKIGYVLKEINEPRTKFKVGDQLHIEITAYEDDEYFFISHMNDDKIIVSNQSKVIKKF
ncbi:hypothetical protein ACN9MN_17560 [Chryseobacterium sp. S-02]|uniref:hypothetical protein n=1 Tax=Chryseobacterium sp. S-02 TaxID=3404064 RepID=UPI003CF3C050